MSDDHAEQILAAAIQAPSGDNMQPWRFRVFGNRILVYRDPTRDRSAYNVLGRADMIALGAAIENASLRAGELGYVVTPAYFPDPEDSLLAAALALAPGLVRPDPLAKAIGQRVTNRLPYRRAALPAETWQQIQELVGDGPPGRIACRSDHQALGRLAAILALAEGMPFGNARYHAALFAAIRWTQQEAQERRDGLSIATLGASPMEAAGLRLLRSWNLVHVLQPLGLQAAFARRGRRLILRSPGIVCVAVPSSSELDFLMGGQLAQRTWLACTLARLAVQPMTGLIWAALRLELLGGEGLSLRERAAIGEAWQALRREFALEGDWRPAMLFRVGLPHRPPPGRAPRRALADCL